MLACLLALAMAVEVQHEFVSLSNLNSRLTSRFNDGWEVVFSSFIVANPGSRNDNAEVLFVFKKGTP